MPEWTLAIGDKIKRTTLHRKFGGSGQSGISPSTKTPNIFLFFDPSSGEQHGYTDEWHSDGCFYYTGHGQRGDQEMKRGNLAIRDHAESGKALRLFKGTGGVVEYMGQFELDPDPPVYWTNAQETGGGKIRSV